MDKITRSRRTSATSSSTSSTESKGLLSPQEVIDSLGPDAFGKKEPEEGAKDLHKKLTDYADQSPELSSKAASEEAPEAFFLGAETRLKDVEADMGKEDSKATLDEREDFSKGVDIIHALFSGEEASFYSINQPAAATDEAAELQRKIEKVKKDFQQSPKSPAPAA
jgi:hypothetical protein